MGAVRKRESLACQLENGTAIIVTTTQMRNSYLQSTGSSRVECGTIVTRKTATDLVTFSYDFRHSLLSRSIAKA